VDLTQIPVIGEAIGNDMSTNTITEPMIRGFMEWMNTQLRDLGLPAGELEMFDRGASELDQQRSWVQYWAVQPEFFGPRLDESGQLLWTPEQMELYEEALAGIVSGVPGNPLSDAARSSYGMEEAITAGLSLVAPGGAPVASQSRTDRMVAADRFRDAGFRGTPEERAASTFRDEATAADPTWVIAMDAYRNIGTPEQREVWDTYWDIVMEPENLRHRNLFFWNGEYWEEFDGAQLQDMSEEERQAFADDWLTKRPGEENTIEQIRTEREAFKAEHPEITDYLTYQKGVYGYDGGAGAFIEHMSSNPNFQRAYEDRKDYLERQGYSGATLQAELEQWAASEAGYHAAIGERDNIYGPDPLPVYDGDQDPYGNSAFRDVMGKGESSGEGTGTTGTTGTSTDPEEDRQKKVWRDYDSPEAQEQKWQQVQDREGWANYTAEMMYGDAWNEETGKWEEWAYDDKGYRQSVTGNEAGNTGYYMTPSDDSPPKWGTAPNENRFEEWRQYMIRTNPNVAQHELTIEAWAAWELGIFNEYLASVRPQAANPPPGAWSRWLEEGIDWNAA
jgi:hypothetical protein